MSTIDSLLVFLTTSPQFFFDPKNQKKIIILDAIQYTKGRIMIERVEYLLAESAVTQSI